MDEELRELSNEELFGEIRRRGVDEAEIMGALKLSDPYPSGGPADRIRRLGMYALAALGGMLVLTIAILALRSQEIPDAISGLAGSAIGAIGGILVGSSLSQSPSSSAPSGGQPAAQ